MAATIARFRKEARAAFAVFLGATVIAAALVALRGVVSPALGFLALLGGGFAVGLCGAELRDTVIATFLMGFVAYFCGTVAFAAGASALAGYPPERVGAEVAIGALVGLVFGVISGAWAAGGGALGAVARRRSRVGHVL